MSQNGWKCYYCNRILKSERGRTQHILATASCRQQQQEEVFTQRNDLDPPEAPYRRSKRLRTAPNAPRPLDVPPVPDAPNANRDQFTLDPPVQFDNPDSSGTESDTKTSSDDEKNVIEDANLVDEGMRTKFRAYALSHADEFPPLKDAEITQIKLLDILKRKRAPLNAYQELLEWHLKESQFLQANESLKDTRYYTDRKAIMKKLVARYNLEGLMPVKKSVRLPFSKANVTVPCIDVKESIVSLLTDPRIQAEDYLFFGDDPRQPPPKQVEWIADLNTGEAHLKTYERLVTNPARQVLLPVVMYIDGATTGQFSELPITALKIALGIHKRTTRDKPYAWRPIAYIPQVRKQPARGKKMLKESGHLDSQDVVVVEGEGDSTDAEASSDESGSDAPDGAPKSQDFHTMLRVALKSFVKLQKTGFIWDLRYKNRLYKDIEFILYVSFVKCDTEEGDLLCGKYTVRTKNVAHCCRYCHCPTDEADDPHAKHKAKTPKEIKRLVDRRDLKGLQKISQQCIRNAFYDVRFHKANDRGIHGATPSEMLHALLLGLFKYGRDIFFEHAGATSKLAEDLDGLAKMYGKLISRQSDRDMPDTNFNKGIRKGKLMAKQYRGVLLNIAAILASTKGRSLMLKRKKFGGIQGLKDWTLLIELLLEWEAFLNEKRIKRSHVQRLAKKHRFIMYIMRIVAKRAEGMGLKLMKFHAVVHLVDDMILYGVPTEYDTGSTESHHKPAKQAAKLTQRNEANFHMQTATRLVEFQAIELAVEEVLHDNMVWDYYDDCYIIEPDSDSVHNLREAVFTDEESQTADLEANAVKVENGGTKLEVFLDAENDNEPAYRVGGRSKHADATSWLTSVVRFLTGLQALVAEHSQTDRLQVFTEHKRDGITFRGHPNYRGTGPWKDWVLINWGTYGKLASRIWCFVQITGLPSSGTALQYGGIKLKDGVYAVVEVADYEEKDEQPADQEGLQSDLFVPVRLETEEPDENGDLERRFYLADANAFEEAIAVVPDIGGPPNRYFILKSRKKWVKEFIRWLEAPHMDDNMEDSDDEE